MRLTLITIQTVLYTRYRLTFVYSVSEAISNSRGIIHYRYRHPIEFSIPKVVRFAHLSNISFPFASSDFCLENFPNHHHQKVAEI